MIKPGLRCLALVTDAFGGRGGIAQYNQDLFKAFAEAGVHMVILPRFADPEFHAPCGLNQLRPRRDRGAYVFTSLLLSTLHNFDFIFCGHIHLAPLCSLIARTTGTKLVVQVHGVEAWQRPSRCQTAALESADLVLSVSRFTRATVLGWANITPERVFVLPDTVDESFKPGEAFSVREKWSMQNKRVLLTVARMDSRERYKGHDRVIASIPDLVADGHDVVYVIVGEGTDRARLQALSRRIGVDERVHFANSITAAQLAAIYRSADLFVMPSTGEGFGIAFLEAMACGTPAVGLAVGGAVDPLSASIGHAVEEKDLTSTIKRLLSIPNGQKEMHANKVRSRFGRSTFNRTARAALDRLMTNL